MAGKGLPGSPDVTEVEKHLLGHEENGEMEIVACTVKK